MKSNINTNTTPTTIPQHRYAQQGFTLIELMIVVAIIGILAAVAVPAYKDYTVKSRFSNIKTLVDPVKTAMALCLQQNAGTIASCDTTTELGVTLPSATADMASIAITATTGLITATATAAAGGYTYILTPPTMAVGDTAVVFTLSGTCTSLGTTC